MPRTLSTPNASPLADFIHMADIKHSTDATFDADVLQSDKPVLVDFWAEWCGPCRAIAPTIEEMAQEYDGQVQVVKVNVDESRAIAAKMGIRGIPTLMMFNGGQLAATKVGALTRSQMSDFIKAHIPQQA